MSTNAKWVAAICGLISLSGFGYLASLPPLPHPVAGPGDPSGPSISLETIYMLVTSIASVTGWRFLGTGLAWAKPWLIALLGGKAVVPTPIPVPTPIQTIPVVPSPIPNTDVVPSPTVDIPAELAEVINSGRAYFADTKDPAAFQRFVLATLNIIRDVVAARLPAAYPAVNSIALLVTNLMFPAEKPTETAA